MEDKIVTSKAKVVLAILTCCFSVICANAQPGCTDPLALNFDASASQNDGSCLYPPTTYAPPQVAELPAEIPEASGLEFFGNQLWLQQDGGDGPKLYTIDTLTGDVLQTFELPDIENHDWEELAEDATYLYVGDFGNNGGNRTDLRIYKISKTDLLAGTATAEAIDFSFSDQTDFTPAFDNSKHDCEAFIVLDDSLHIFTKSWPDKMTRRYLLPTSPGTHIAELRDSFDVGTLVTAADVGSDGTVLLLGYDGSTSETSLWLLWDYPSTSVFGGNKRKLTLGTALNMSQAEGIAFSSPTMGFICSERISFLPQRLLRFDVGQWVELPSATGGQQAGAVFSASPNPFTTSLSIDFQGFAKEGDQLALCSADGQILRSELLRSGRNTLLTGDLPKGIYFIFVKNGAQTWRRRVLKQ